MERKINFRELEKQGGWLLRFPEEEQDEIALMHDEYLKTLADAEEYWRRVEYPKVQKALAEWKEQEKEFGLSCRKRYLFGQLEELRTEQNKLLMRFYASSMSEEESSRLKVVRKKIFSLGKSLEVLEGKAKGITDDMIERAREYPLSRLLDINQQGFALCINHQDSKPSMFTKKNFAHCFSCQWHGDAIDVYRKIHGCGFPEAVTVLSGGV